MGKFIKEKNRLALFLLIAICMVNIIGTFPRTAFAVGESTVILSTTSLEGRPQVGIPFTLKDFNGNPLGTYYSDVQGKIIVDLPDGSYFFETDTNHAIYDPNYVPSPGATPEAIRTVNFTVAGDTTLLRATMIATVNLQVNEKETNNPIVGVPYVLKKIETTNFPVEETAYHMTTDASGKIVFNNIPPGTYELVKVTDQNIPASQGFALPDKQTILIPEDNPKVINLTSEIAATKKITIQLQEVTGNGIQDLKKSGVTVTISGYSDESWELISDERITTDENGQVTYTAVAGTTYTIRNNIIDGYESPPSIAYPNGWVRPGESPTPDTVYLINLKPPEPLPLRRITINKTDENGNPLTGVDFNVFSSQGNYSAITAILPNGFQLYKDDSLGENGVVSTDDNGQISIQITGDAEVALVEKTAPAGYKLSPDVIYIPRGTEDVSVTIKNFPVSPDTPPKSHEFKVIDPTKDPAIPVEGATYAIYEYEPTADPLTNYPDDKYINGQLFRKIGSYTSDAKGVLQEVLLDPNKTYYYQFESAPQEYQPMPPPIQNFVLVDTSAPSTTIDLAPVGYSRIPVHVYGVNADGSTTDLAGITVKIYDTNGDEVDSVVTDDRGYAESKILKTAIPNPDNPWDSTPVRYRLSQFDTASGYTKSPDIYSNNIHKNGIPMANVAATPNTTITKVDSTASNKLLQGAKFAVYAYKEIVYPVGPGPKAYDLTSYVEPPIYAENQILYNGKLYTKIGEYKTDANGQISVNLPAKQFLPEGPNGEVLEVNFEYLVKEFQAPDGYLLNSPNDPVPVTPKMTLKNTPVPTKTIKATKVWEGGENLGTRPTVQFQLYRDGEAYRDPITVDSTTNQVTFTDLPQYNQNGREYRYTVEEVSVPDDYEKSGTVYDEATGDATIINTYKPGVTSHTVNKVWEGGPVDKTQNIEVALYAIASDGTETLVDENIAPEIVNPTTLTVNTHTWSNLPKTDKSGTEYVYMAKETEIDGVAVVNGKAGNYESLISNPIESKGNSTTITNKFVPDKISLYAKKIWEGGVDSEHIQPTFELYRNGIKVDNVTPTVSPENGSSQEFTFEWKDLDKTDLFGQDYLYSIKEINTNPNYGASEVKGAGTAEDPFLITNTKVGIKIPFEKRWVGGPAEKPTVTIKLEAKVGDTSVYVVENEGVYSIKTALESGDVEATKVLENGTLKGTFENLPAFDTTGKSITYSVKEIKVGNDNVVENKAGNYIVSQIGNVITNTYSETKSVTITKTWVDDNNSGSTRPDTITFQAVQMKLEDGAIEPTVTGKIFDKVVEVKKENTEEAAKATYTIEDLPAYDTDGKDFTYKVKEVPVAGYETAEITGEGTTDKPYAVTNTVKATQTLEFEKVWVGGSADERTKAAATVKLQIGGADITTEVLTNLGITIPTTEVEINSITETDGKLTGKFENLPSFDKTGKAITYSLVETMADGAMFDKSAKTVGNTTIFTNTYKPKVATITATKTWSGGPKTDNDSVELMLARTPEGGAREFVGDKITTSPVNGKQTATWTDMPTQNSDGVAYKYEVVEVNVPAGYTPSYSGDATNGFVVTNTYNSDKTDITAYKRWIGGPAEKPEIELQLLRNGSPITDVDNKILPSGEIEVTWEGLDKTDENGNDYIYTVNEVEVPAGYQATYKGLEVTNTYKPDAKDITVSKEWIGGTNRPPVQVQLFRQAGSGNKEFVGIAQSLNDGNDWKYTWSGLEVTNSDGLDYVYSVDEVAVPSGYTKEVSGDAVSGFVIKNTYKPTESSVIPKVNKSLLGRNLQEGEFEFTIKETDGSYTDKVTNDAFGNVIFSPITYKNPGTYTYEIAEVKGANTTITYDTSVITMTVNVEEVNGSLVATESYSPDRLFENTYKPSASSIVPSASKVLEGKTLVSGQFTFGLYQGSDADPIQTATNNLDGTINFQEIKYDKAGTYTYRIKEIIPDPKDPNISYDTREITFTVDVTDVNGSLVAKVNYPADMTFKNIYKPSATTTVLEGKKILEGKALEADEFIFELKDDSGKSLGITRNDGFGNFSFNLSEFTSPGDYNYTITEINGKLQGMTYDLVPVEVIVNVKDDGSGKLVSTVSYTKGTEDLSSAEFRNSYKADSSSTNIVLRKELLGGSLKASEFNFVMVDKDDSTNTWTVSNDQYGNIVFPAITYDKAGDYTYSIKEVIPTDKDPNISYDDSEILVNVNVKDVSGKLVASVTYPEDITFTNSYSTAQKSVTANKIWVGGPADKPSIQIQLYREALGGNKEYVGSPKTLLNGQTSYTWEDLPTHNSDGDEYIYTVDEVKVPENYSKTRSQDGLTVTNTFNSTLNTTEVIVHKTWAIDKAEDRTATFNLVVNGQPAMDMDGKEVASLTITGNGSGKFTNLPLNDSDGKPIAYTVKETPIEGFKTIQAGNAADGFVFTNYPEDKFGVVLQKIDADSKAVLPGAVFELSKGNPGQGTTTTSGTSSTLAVTSSAMDETGLEESPSSSQEGKEGILVKLVGDSPSKLEVTLMKNGEVTDNKILLSPDKSEDKFYVEPDQMALYTLDIDPVFGYDLAVSALVQGFQIQANQVASQEGQAGPDNSQLKAKVEALRTSIDEAIESILGNDGLLADIIKTAFVPVYNKLADIETTVGSSPDSQASPGGSESGSLVNTAILRLSGSSTSPETSTIATSSAS